MGNKNFKNKYLLLVIAYVSFTLCSCFSPIDKERVQMYGISFISQESPTNNSVYFVKSAHWTLDPRKNQKAGIPITVKGMNNVYGATIEIVYDSSKISVDNFTVTEGVFFNKGQIKTNFSAKYKEQPGKIIIDISRIDSTGISGDGKVATILIGTYTKTNTDILFNSTNCKLLSSDYIVNTQWLGGNYDCIMTYIEEDNSIYPWDFMDLGELGNN